MYPAVSHLHTYFFFPFSVDKQALLRDHRELWSKYQYWIDGTDEWIAAHQRGADTQLINALGRWKRTAYTRFDVNSRAYQDMVFFHPFVRRVYFDSIGASSRGSTRESLLRCYTLPVAERADDQSPDPRLWLEASDIKGRGASVSVTDLRLFLFANGIGILSIGVEATDLTAGDALWINETLRKIYPSSGRQVREGRVPNRLALVTQHEGQRRTIVEETFEGGSMVGFVPPLSATITSLLYFADYSRQEYEPVLDERMIVYSYIALDPVTAPEEYLTSEEHRVLLSRFLYVDRHGDEYRYDPVFVRGQMANQMYRRWAHQGTYYGFTSYSAITVTLGTFDCDEHRLEEGFLIHRMFESRYYLMSIIALFYRATLLDFAERTALVSKHLYLDQQDGQLGPQNIRLASDLRADFLNFSNYWHFRELANKDEEVEHFAIQCREYGIAPMKAEIEEEIEKLNAALHTYYQFRNTEAVNRLAMLSLLFGAGAVLTGFFGMNFGGFFQTVFFEPDGRTVGIHWLAILMVVVFSVGALFFGLFVVVSNWSDYRGIVAPKVRVREEESSLKRGD